MILIIDTSSPKQSFVATVDGAVVEELSAPRLDFEALRRIARSGPVTKVAVATGPGSFTGLRVGVSFGLGLAMGLRVPIVPLLTLDLQAARSAEPVTAVVDAGRGRCYYRVPGAEPALGEPADVPSSHPLVGNVSDRRPFVAAGHRFTPEGELRPFAQAAIILLETAREVPYRNLEIEYMQSLSVPQKRKA
jgi:tRNA threonylcarbamoyl adenosine modification protein YeaZ